MKAWHKSASAQKAAMKAAAAAVTGDLAAQVAAINITAALIQQPVENITALDAIAANASAAVQAAEEAVSEAASDEKKAAAAAAVAKYAADKSAEKMKINEHKADAAYTNAMKAMHKADAMARKARAAAEDILAAEWTLDGAAAANASATLTVPVAQNGTFATAAALRSAKDAESAAAATVEATTDEAMREKVIDTAAGAADDATETAGDAAAARIISDYTAWEKDNAVAAADNATDYLKAANTDYHDSLHLSNKAESNAVHGANQAQKFDEKMAAATLDPSVNVTDPAEEDPVVQTVVVTKAGP